MADISEKMSTDPMDPQLALEKVLEHISNAKAICIENDKHKRYIDFLESYNKKLTIENTLLYEIYATMYTDYWRRPNAQKKKENHKIPESSEGFFTKVSRNDS